MTTQAMDPWSDTKQSAAGRGARAPIGVGEGTIPAGRSGRTRLCYVHPDLVRDARDRLRAQTADCVMETLGISVNTWVKMRDGKPIRMSVAERFVQRVGASR
ncbi:hypothetical protein NDN01_16235 [Sphingomonas sp. QA11]|uniref:hypothetical protein n=1 Tax=Sphingomonas sp. QA11 TaxID=2950605 RepID=UPI0023496FEF|nr:hypothetical protein [Sphingomonas sp. QA11]WCM25586.1 hypothetical protein NDN01_16235 [Sphingomonas sp. QA11]